MAMEGGFPDEFVSIFCIWDAPHPKNGKSLAMATYQRTLASPAAVYQMGRLLGSRGNAARRDVLRAADLDTSSEEEVYTAWVAYRKAK